ncbi:hypothetical protein TrVE_jg4076 [Triparma verrucosa]|uniref:SH3 domain-containing protein n=1 Tax=Triparma verrucosa TaxID=1606542 RepID=A0A9W7BD77_9STRA|nr:hypothetical protein TrVE_jg4076 [Triparma verrucosa]
MPDWFYGDENGDQQGPVHISELRSLYAQKSIMADTLLWNETMEEWLELSELPDLMKRLDQPPPPPKSQRVPSIAPPAAPVPPGGDKDDWELVENSSHQPPVGSPASKNTGGSPVLVERPSSNKEKAHISYNDDGDDYNDIGLKKVGYRDGEGGRQDQYTPGWALGDETRDDIMQTAVSKDLAEKLGIESNPTPTEYTNNLGLKVTGNSVQGSMYGDYSDIGGKNAGGRKIDGTVDDYQGTSSASLHKQNMDKTGVEKGTVKSMRAAAFGSKRSEKTDEIAPGVKMITAKSLDNTLDIIYNVINENTDGVKITLDFGGSSGISLEGGLGSGEKLKVEAFVDAQEKMQVAKVTQLPGQLASVRIAVGVAGALGGRGNAPAAPARRNSVRVADAERKQLAPNLFLLKQKVSSPLGYIYSIENGRTKDYSFSMDFEGSKNIRIEGKASDVTKVEVVVAPGDTVTVATVVQAMMTEGIAVKTKMGVKELKTASAPRGGGGGLGGGAGVGGGVELRGPAGSSLKKAIKNYRAAKGDEMDVFEGDEIFLQGGNAGDGDGWVVGINARSGAAGLVPADVLADAVDGAGSGGGSFNNVYRKSPSGGWAGGKAKAVETVDVVPRKAPGPPLPPKKNLGPRAQPLGQPQPVALAGMGGAGREGLVSYGDRTVSYTNESKKFAGIRVDPRSGKVTQLAPGQTKTWVREDAVVRGYER